MCLCIGLNRLSEWETIDASERQKYQHRIETFPDKVDQLLAACDRVRIIFAVPFRATMSLSR